MSSQSFVESCVSNTAESGLNYRNRHKTFEVLLGRSQHWQVLERIARKHTRGTSIAWEDAVQDAQVKILEAVKSGKFRYGGEQEFYRWSSTVARFEIIELVRRQKRRPESSIDQRVAGTDLSLSETIAAECNPSESLERADLVLRALEAIQHLEQGYPDRQYLKLWQGMMQGKKQAQLAVELGLSQGAISKRWQELIQRVTERLGLAA